MEKNNLTEYLKTAFEYKNNGDYKKSIDYFYKALAVDNESFEIMSELALLYTKLCRYDRAVSFYEQILQKEPENDFVKFEFAKLLLTINEENKAENILSSLFDKGFELDKTAKELFSIYFNQQNYEKIITCYNKYSNSIKNSEALYYTACAYSKTGKEEIAENFYEKSYQNDEKNILAGVKVADCLFKNNHTEEAECIALKLLKYGENAEIFYLLAETAYFKSDIDSAMKYYSYAIKINPQNSLYFFKLAIVFSLKGFFKEAEECFAKAIDIEPSNQTYNYALAYLYYMNKEKELSEKQTDYVLSLNPGNPQALSLKMLILIEKQEMIGAGKILDILSTANVENDFSYYVQAVYYSKLNLWKNAIEAINKAININDHSLEYKYQLAESYYMLENYDKAEAICDEITTINSKYIQAYILNSKIKLQIGKYDLSEIYVNKTLELDKNINEAYSVLGDISFLKQNYEDAIKNYKIAVSIKPNEEEYYAKIANCCYLAGSYKDAYFYYKEASNFDITNASYRYYMAKCSEFLGDTENAASNFSVMKRLAPKNIEFISEYTNFLYNNKKKKTAISIIKIMIKNAQPSEKAQLELLLESYK
ncbi:MAG: hypothetical protein LUH05_03155 [Candidatus Gastranaerophilales bacterium]|nr:hypothetical protein [Candidatus Gastranaerophilales bacterium]